MSVTFADITAMLAARPPLAAAVPCHLVKHMTALQADCVQLSGDWTALIQNLAQLQQKKLAAAQASARGAVCLELRAKP